ncbi:hypothetical protein ACJJTC_013582 [Scirpophaga incertulas]
MKCASCLTEARDMAQCSICMKCFDFNCAGITESGFRKLGDRKITWKCPQLQEWLFLETNYYWKSFNTALSTLAQDIKSIKEDIQQLKNSVEYAHESSKICDGKISDLEQRMSVIESTQENVTSQNQRIADLEDFIKQKDQADRLNNAEVKGIPFKESENLFDVVSKLGAAIGCNVAKTEINYVVRVPTRIDPKKKNIIISFNNRYHKENFVACSRSHKNLSIADIGKDQTSPIKYVKSELDLKKL